MVKIIFSDIDGTLLHAYSPGFALVKIEEEEKYVSTDAVSAIAQLRSRSVKFALVTGRRKSGYERLAGAIPHDYALIEHGCVILANGSIDAGWAEVLRPVTGQIGAGTGPIWDYEQQLLQEGFKTDSKGRLSTVRVYIDEPNNLSEEQKRRIEQKVEKEAGHLGITTAENEGMVDIVPALGGKMNSIAYLLTKTGFSIDEIVALGNDTNDLDMLSIAMQVACPGNAKPEVKRIVGEKGGYVSAYPCHEGTMDLFRNYVEPLLSV